MDNRTHLCQMHYLRRVIRQPLLRLVLLMLGYFWLTNTYAGPCPTTGKIVASERTEDINLLVIQQSVVTGVVMDADGSPLPGASILEKGTANGTQADFDGNFSLAIEDQNSVLVI